MQNYFSIIKLNSNIVFTELWIWIIDMLNKGNNKITKLPNSEQLYNVLTNQIGVYICDFYRHVFCFVFPEIV